MFKNRIYANFPAGHHIEDYPGKCANFHGHNYAVEVRVGGTKLDELKILVDFGELKSILKTIIDELDHTDLNQLLNEKHVTAEFLAKYIYTVFRDLLKQRTQTVFLDRVRVWETDDNSSEYYDEKEVSKWMR